MEGKGYNVMSNVLMLLLIYIRQNWHIAVLKINPKSWSLKESCLILVIICDVIKQNQSEVGNIDFEI